MSEINPVGAGGLEEILGLPPTARHGVDIFIVADGEIEGRLALSRAERRGFSFYLPARGESDESARARGYSEESGDPRWLTEEAASAASEEIGVVVVVVAYWSTHEAAGDAGYYDDLLGTVDVPFPSISWGSERERKADIEAAGVRMWLELHPE